MENKFYIIGLQETMQADIDDRILRQIDPSQAYLWKWIPSRGKSGGILSGVRIELLDVGTFKEGKYILQLNLWDKTQKRKWNFLNVYGSPHEECKAEFLIELASFCGGCQVPYVIGGDFNLIRFSSEKNKVCSISKHSKNFNSIIACYDIMDLGMAGGKFTWSNNQSPPTLERLDRVLVSKSWEDMFPTAIVSKLPREISDHNPLILNSSQQQPLRKLSFRFELMWLRNPEFLPTTQTIWDKPSHAETAFDRIQAKLKRFKQFFKEWGFNRQGRQRKIKKTLQEELTMLELEEESYDLNLDQLHRKVEVRKNIMSILKEEELYWFRRSHSTWLLEGDNNIEFFHRIANGRKRENTIISLMDGDQVIEGEANLLNHATE